MSANPWSKTTVRIKKRKGNYVQPTVDHPLPRLLPPKANFLDPRLIIRLFPISVFFFKSHALFSLLLALQRCILLPVTFRLYLFASCYTAGIQPYWVALLRVFTSMLENTLLRACTSFHPSICADWQLAHFQGFAVVSGTAENTLMRVSRCPQARSPPLGIPLGMKCLWRKT